jgi:hypothetical protein
MCKIIIGNEIPNDFMYLQSFFYYYSHDERLLKKKNKK